eukprot:TRINITY_DN7658_c0_g2_i1.p1 TRINITY_DN7658_c0_g2~~TRINITY_DN7658_c0_g2_i1.p1  ORF type:complete len:275 (+),score=47.30 TRINITY_DN7658_c0_g2_i1:75-827(+)
MPMPQMREGDWTCPACSNHNFASRTACNKCGTPKPGLSPGAGGGMSGYGSYAMQASYGGGGGAKTSLPPNARPGDWMCAACGNHNYASKAFCNRCGAPPPGAGGGGGYGMSRSDYGAARPSPYAGMMMGGKGGKSMMMAMAGMPKDMRAGDWICPACNNHNYASKTHCNKCGVPKETKLSNTGMREGDWICRSCGNHNYADKTNCNRCQAPKGDTPSHEKNGGNWICPACGNKNFAHRTVCNRCSAPKPA